MTFRAVFILSMLIIISAPIQANPPCAFTPWMNYQKTKVFSRPDGLAYLFYSTHIAVDADGAPNAYHPNDTGLDFLANAGYPNKSWWNSVLVEDPGNPKVAYTQKKGAYKGYFVSRTSLQDTSKRITDPLRYVDARTIPYLVFPGSFYKIKGTGYLGDLGIAIHLSTGKNSPFVLGDIGPYNAALGEISIALAEGLGGSHVNPKNGAGVMAGEVLYLVFPYSSRTYPWPLSIDEIETYTYRLLEKAGGIEGILACRNTK